MRPRWLILVVLIVASSWLVWTGGRDASSDGGSADARHSAWSAQFRDWLALGGESSSASREGDSSGARRSSSGESGPGNGHAGNVDSPRDHGHGPGTASGAPRGSDSESGADDVAPPTAKEEAVLVMYDSLASAFEAHAQDCAAMADTVERLVREHRGAVANVVQEQASLNDAERAAARARLEKSSGPRMERARSAMRSGLARCSDNAQLQASIQELAAMSAR
jgi:hypothetical protein